LVLVGQILEQSRRRCKYDSKRYAYVLLYTISHKLETENVTANSATDPVTLVAGEMRLWRLPAIAGTMGIVQITKSRSTINNVRIYAFPGTFYLSTN
jgi:hypothetical protein